MCVVYYTRAVHPAEHNYTIIIFMCAGVRVQACVYVHVYRKLMHFVQLQVHDVDGHYIIITLCSSLV